MGSIFEDLCGTLDALNGPSPNGGTFGAAYCDQVGSEPLVGLNFVTNYRFEEESGIGVLRRRITSENPRQMHMTAGAAECVAIFTDVNALALCTCPLPNQSPQWGEALWGREVEYAARYGQRVHTAHKICSTWALQRKTVPELRALAKELGVKPLPKKRDDLLMAIERASQVGPPESANLWPAWFRDGNTLVLRAETEAYGEPNLTGQILARLRDAAQEGTLALGNGSGPFSTGLFLYDARDETEANIKSRCERADWTEEQLALLAPVAESLKADGYGMYALQNPRLIDGVVRYWMNSHWINEAGGQVYGWFTLDELKDRTFVSKFLQDKAKVS